MEDLALRRASSSPHIHAGRSVQGVMLEVIIALVPAGAFGVYYFGWRALLIIAVSVLSAVFWEWLYTRIAKKPCTVGDLSGRLPRMCGVDLLAATRTPGGGRGPDGPDGAAVGL